MAEDKGRCYSVQVHTAARGFETLYVTAETGDDAALKALATHPHADTSIRGISPASEPDLPAAPPADPAEDLND